MSADLLRRAAAVLREHVARMPEPWRVHPWRGVQSDTESIDGLAACASSHENDEWGTDDCCVTSGADGLGHASIAAYAALLSPPVALLLAGLLEQLADAAPTTVEDCECVDVDGWHHAVYLARAILLGPDGGVS